MGKAAPTSQHKRVRYVWWDAWYQMFKFPNVAHEFATIPFLVDAAQVCQG